VTTSRMSRAACTLGPRAAPAATAPAPSCVLLRPVCTHALYLHLSVYQDGRLWAGQRFRPFANSVGFTVRHVRGCAVPA